MKTIELKDVLSAMTPAEAKLIADGAVVFVGPTPDPQDAEKYVDAAPKE